MVYRGIVINIEIHNKELTASEHTVLIFGASLLFSRQFRFLALILVFGAISSSIFATNRKTQKRETTIFIHFATYLSRACSKLPLLYTMYSRIDSEEFCILSALYFEFRERVICTLNKFICAYILYPLPYRRRRLLAGVGLVWKWSSCTLYNVHATTSYVFNLWCWVIKLRFVRTFNSLLP